MPTAYFQLLVRLLACSAVAAVVAGTALVCAWNNTRDARGFWEGQAYTLHHLEALRDVLDRHRQEVGRYPERLDELRWPPPEPGQPDRPVAPEELMDLWKQPYQYWVDGGGYTLFSLGRDGRPGGIGLDADLYGPGMQDCRPTLRQFVFEAPSGGILLTCGLAGGCTFLLGLQQGVGKPVRWPSLVKFGLTAVACVVTAVVMSILHIPTGH